MAKRTTTQRDDTGTYAEGYPKTLTHKNGQTRKVFNVAGQVKAEFDGFAPAKAEQAVATTVSQTSSTSTSDKS